MQIKTKVAVIATAAVVAVPMATAATAGYWNEGGSSYSCQGLSDAVICRDKIGGYDIAITKTYIGIMHGKQVVYGCTRRSHSCVEG
jgi:hypothetical protein